MTTLYFEADEEDELRKSGFSKERRIDPQILVGLLVDRHGFPLELHFFEGNKAEIRTMIPVLDAFRDRHHVSDIQALEEAGYQYIVGSRSSKAPWTWPPRSLRKAITSPTARSSRPPPS